jgi:hypothetical protein
LPLDTICFTLAHIILSILEVASTELRAVAVSDLSVYTGITSKPLTLTLIQTNKQTNAMV